MGAGRTCGGTTARLPGPRRRPRRSHTAGWPPLPPAAPGSSGRRRPGEGEAGLGAGLGGGEAAAEEAGALTGRLMRGGGR